jgi:hypothetical protein
MLPMVSLPPTLQKNLQPYRAVFCRTAGFAQVSRYLTGLLLSPNKTLQGIHAQWVWPQGERVERRSMHAAVFESRGWDGSMSPLQSNHAIEVSTAMRQDLWHVVFSPLCP